MRIFTLGQTIRTAVISTAMLASAGGAAMAGNYDSMVVFGDSLSDNGNLCAGAPRNVARGVQALLVRYRLSLL